MPSFIIEDFKSGLDRRRMNETSIPGSLVLCENAHITRGGEIEKSESFNRFKNLPDNTFGLKATGNGFVVFGSDDIQPPLLHSNPPIKYQRLNDGAANMIRVLSVDLFDAKPYVIAEYDDGITRHFYDGAKVTEFFSGKARAKFTIEADPDAGPFQASGSFVIQDDGNPGDKITGVLVNAVNILAAEVVVPAGVDDLSFVGIIVDAINENSNISGYSASIVAGNKVVVTSQVPGADPNGYSIGVAKTGAINITNATSMANGRDASEISDIKVNGVSIITAPVSWTGSNQQTSAAVAFAINENTTASGYEAFAFGSEVLLRAAVDGIAANGFAVVVSTAGVEPISITPAVITMSGGSATATKTEPGRFAKTVKSKMYVLSGPSMYYSAVDDPTDMAGTGAGFNNLSNNTSGAEQLVAMANYFTSVALFSRSVVQIWFVDVDGDNNSQTQVLNNTGTIAPRSVVEFGDNDVFYLHESGIRSLRARDNTNSAFVNDVGISIDTLIQSEILNNSVAAENSVAIIEPRNGRYMLSIGRTVYVFSYFPTSKISAWSTYAPGFVIEEIGYVGQTVVARSRNALYTLGAATERKYDGRATTIITPFHADKDPALIKQWCGLDIACEGTWDIYACFGPDPETANLGDFMEDAIWEHITTVTGTTFNDDGGENGNVGLDGQATHIALKLVNRTPEYGRIGLIELHYADGGSKQ